MTTRHLHVIRPTAVHEARFGLLHDAVLACGLLSSVLYLAADLIGGLQYPGYDFSSRAVSELMALGAPSRSLVDPLFIAYPVLALIFAAGVVRSAGSNGALRMTGVFLIGYALASLTGPTLFPMQSASAHTVRDDLAHIILTAALVSFLFLAFAFGAFAIGKRFRAYSVVTLLVVMVSGAMTTPYATRLAAHEPTPGLGIFERVNIYVSLLWVAVLSVALLRQARHRGRVVARATIQDVRRLMRHKRHA